MMQALLQQQLGDAYEVESAGIRKEAAGLPANERSIQCMRERGIDLTKHQSRWAGDLDLGQFPHIVCVSEDVANLVRELLGANSGTNIMIANGDRGGIPDPFDKRLPGYMTCLHLLDEITPKIAKLVRCVRRQHL
jgi:protein-tyrosine-phosphatase